MKLSNLFVLPLILVNLLSGCAHKKRSSNNSGFTTSRGEIEQATSDAKPESEMMGPEVPMGPNPDADFVPPEQSYLVIFGPGLARSLAYIGVLHAIEQKKIKVVGIMATELGAVIASIWSTSGINQLEWQMYKFKKDDLFDFPLLKIKKDIASGKKLIEFLTNTIKVDRLENFKTHVWVGSIIHTESQDKVIWENEGPSIEILRASAGIPGLIEAQVVDGNQRYTAGLEEPYPSQFAKKLGLGKVICFDVLGSGSDFTSSNRIDGQLLSLMKSTSVVSRQQLLGCEETVFIDTKGISFTDFNSRAELIYRGKVAAQKWLEKP